MKLLLAGKNGGPLHKENMLFPVSLSVHPAFSGTFFDLTVRRRMSGHFGSERAQTV